MFNALNASSAELAVLSRDINHLTQLLRQGRVEAAFGLGRARPGRALFPVFNG